MTFHLIGGDQIAIQVPIAAIVTVSLFMFYWYLLSIIPSKPPFYKPVSLIWIFIVALFWHPVIFIPLHYVTQGYVTSIRNILAMMLFQMLINTVTLAFVYYSFFTKR